jgi:hypothetical protein
MRLQHFIDRLEEFSALQGVAVFRTPLSPWVLGRMDQKRVLLRSGLSKEQQFLTLVHEPCASTKLRPWRNWLPVSWASKTGAPLST